MHIEDVAVDEAASQEQFQLVEAVLRDSGYQGEVGVYSTRSAGVNIAQIIVGAVLGGTVTAALTRGTGAAIDAGADLMRRLRDSRGDREAKIGLTDESGVMIVIPVDVSEAAMVALHELDRVKTAGASGTLVWNDRHQRWESPWPQDNVD